MAADHPKTATHCLICTGCPLLFIFQNLIDLIKLFLGIFLFNLTCQHVTSHKKCCEFLFWMPFLCLFVQMSLTTHSFLSCLYSQPLCFCVISSFQMQFMLLFSRQGKLRLQKWYVPLSDKEKKKITRELVQTVLARKPKMCSFLEWRDLKIVYKRWVGTGLVSEQNVFWLNALRIEYFHTSLGNS